MNIMQISLYDRILNNKLRIGIVVKHFVAYVCGLVWEQNKMQKNE